MKRTTSFLPLVALLASPLALAAQAPQAAGSTVSRPPAPQPPPERPGYQAFVLDRAHSEAGFKVRHMAVGHVRGHFREISGTLYLHEWDILKSEVAVTIGVASIDTENERRDNDLRTNFLEAEKHPEITFRSKRIEKKGEAYVAVGDLSIHGTTREVQLPFTLVGPTPVRNALRLGVDGELTVDRRDYGVVFNPLAEAVQVAGDIVTLQVTAEFTRRLAGAGPS